MRETYLVGFTGSSVVVVATAKSSKESRSEAEVVCGTLAISRVSLRANQVTTPLDAALLPYLCLRCQHEWLWLSSKP